MVTELGSIGKVETHSHDGWSGDPMDRLGTRAHVHATTMARYPADPGGRHGPSKAIYPFVMVLAATLTTPVAFAQAAGIASPGDTSPVIGHLAGYADATYVATALLLACPILHVFGHGGHHGHGHRSDEMPTRDDTPRTNPRTISHRDPGDLP